MSVYLLTLVLARIRLCVHNGRRVLELCKGSIAIGCGRSHSLGCP
jgi:hypothetical protein